MNRLTFISILFITCLPFFAFAAQPPKPVKVVNTPSVRVKNTPAVTVPHGVTINNEESDPVPVSIVDNGGENGGQTASEYRLVGFTNDLTNGFIRNPAGPDSGYREMHRRCQNDVAPNARACFASEVSRPSTTAAINIRGWVIHSRNVTVVFDGINFTAIDSGSGVNASGSSANFAISKLNCDQFQANSGSFSGQIAEANTNRALPSFCNQNHLIACCAPVAVPVTPLPTP